MAQLQRFCDRFGALQHDDDDRPGYTVDFPQELIDKIINHIPWKDKESLQSCSLVARSWAYTSQRRLFEKVNIAGDKRLKWWQSNIPPTNVELLQHVRSLSYEIPKARSDCPIRDYSPSFRQLRDLSLHGGYPLSSFDQIGTPAAFQHTLSYFRLRCCKVTTSALVTIINYFPNLAHLDLSEVSYSLDSQHTPPISRPLQKLSIREFNRTGLDLVEQLMGLRPQCDDVTVSLYVASCPSLIHRVIDGVGANVKRLSLEWWPSDEEAPVTLSNCQELRELDLSVMHPWRVELGLISSITSTHMQRITFNHPRMYHELPVRDRPDWTQFDDSLCRLVDRSERGLRLEVSFYKSPMQVWWTGELGLKKRLPRFYEKGGVSGG